MKIFRMETLLFEVHPDDNFNVEDLKAIIRKTQDLTFDSHIFAKNRNAHLFTVLREVELYPDTIK